MSETEERRACAYLKVGVGDRVAADVALAPGVLELPAHEALQLRHGGVGAEVLVLPAQRAHLHARGKYWTCITLMLILGTGTSTTYRSYDQCFGSGTPPTFFFGCPDPGPHGSAIYLPDPDPHPA